MKTKTVNLNHNPAQSKQRLWVEFESHGVIKHGHLYTMSNLIHKKETRKVLLWMERQINTDLKKNEKEKTIGHLNKE